MQTILFIKIWIGFDKRHKKCASTAIYIEKLLTTYLPTTICKMCDKRFYKMLLCFAAVLFRMCVWVCCECSSLCAFFLLLLIPLKHYNIILTHSKHIKRNACWVNKFFSSSFSASSKDTNIERTYSKLYSCHSILHSEQLIFEKEKNTIHSILVGMWACVCVVRIQSHPGQTYIFVCFLLKNGVKFNSYPE